MPKTAQELTDYLMREQVAIAKGERDSSEFAGDPWYERFNSFSIEEWRDAGNEIALYHSIRAEAWKYQASHNISALYYKKFEVDGESIELLESHGQLVLMPDDVERLNNQSQILKDFWLGFCRNRPHCHTFMVEHRGQEELEYSWHLDCVSEELAEWSNGIELFCDFRGCGIEGWQELCFHVFNTEWKAFEMMPESTDRSLRAVLRVPAEVSP